jgi:hypothetical protein
MPTHTRPATKNPRAVCNFCMMQCSKCGIEWIQYHSCGSGKSWPIRISLSSTPNRAVNAADETFTTDSNVETKQPVNNLSSKFAQLVTKYVEPAKAIFKAPDSQPASYRSMSRNARRDYREARTAKRDHLDRAERSRRSSSVSGLDDSSLKSSATLENKQIRSRSLGRPTAPPRQVSKSAILCQNQPNESILQQDNYGIAGYIDLVSGYLGISSDGKGAPHASASWDDQPKSPSSSNISPRNVKCKGCNGQVSTGPHFYLKDVKSWYHHKCFTCHECGDFFSDDNPYVLHNEQAYCERDYQAIFHNSRICGYCKEFVSDTEKIYVFGVGLHKTHLNCTKCQKHIPETFVEHNNRVYCLEDYSLVNDKTCAYCNAIMYQEDCIIAANKGWHRRCLKCTTCQRPFNDMQYFVFKGDPFCKYHYHKVSQTCCAACKCPIEGSCIVSHRGDKYHPKHWTCAECKCVLEQDYFMHQGKPYCETHFQKKGRQNGKSATRYRSTRR